ncbi:MAG: hypothetical protein KAT00_14210 [Planctomycetes bacterium]|nr:hypothetical protein [Planctomycetota bacterium]
MDIITIAELLRQVEEFERKVTDLYEKLSGETTHEGVHMVADYLSRHRLRTHRALLALPADSVEQMRQIRNTPLRYEPEEPGRHFFDNIELPADATADDLLDIAISFDECLIKFYQQVVQRPIDRNIKTFFESLIRWEEGDEIEMKKMKATHYF